MQLSDYTTVDDVGDMIVDALEPYATKNYVKNAVAPCAKKSDLSAYAKSSDLSAYVSNDKLSSTISAYAKTNDLSAYAKASELSAYAKTGQLSAYVRTNALSAVSIKENPTQREIAAVVKAQLSVLGGKTVHD